MGKASRNKRRHKGGGAADEGRSAHRSQHAARGGAPGRLFAGDGSQLFGLFLLIAVFYFPATRAGFVWDDMIMTGSEAVRSWSGLWQLWFETETTYHPDNTREGHFWPLVYTTFWLEHKLWGYAPLGYHLTNLLLHCANCWLIWRLLRYLAVPGAWFAAAIFAVHPVHVEAVVWVIARKDLLSTLFYLLAAFSWLRFMDAPKPGRYALALGAYIAAMLSKTIVASLPVALLIAQWWRNGRITRRDMLRVLPFFVLGLALALHDTFFYQTREAVSFDYSIPDRVLIASQALWFYLGKLLWPVDLAVIYPRWAIDATALTAWLWPLAALMVVALLWAFRRALGHGPLAGALFFAVTLAPVLGIFDSIYMQWSFVADRYQYLASLGVIAVVIGLVTHATRALTGPWRPATLAAAGALLLTFGVLSWRQAGIYEDNITFNSHIISLNPAARDVWLNLGVALANADQDTEALAAAQQAIKLRPDSLRAYTNAGKALVALARYDEAEAVLRRGIARTRDENSHISPNTDGYPGLFLDLAAVLERLEQFDEALAVYNELLQAQPGEGGGLFGAGGLLVRMGRFEEALVFLRQGLTQTQPPVSGHDFVRARLFMQMSVAAQQLGRHEEAAEHRRIALMNVPAAPGPAYGVAEPLHEDGRLSEAVAWYAAALERDPKFAVAYAAMGDALFGLGRYDEAMAQVRRARSLLPADPELARRLTHLTARTHAAQGNMAAAVAAYQRLLQRAPGDVVALRELVSLYFDYKQYAQALDVLEALAAVAPNDAEVRVNIGVVLHNLGRSEEALAQFEQALVMDPNSASAQSNRALVRQSLPADSAAPVAP